ncbi:bifunctional UDP-N-acetylmuramoyl-tripeptide:D-alanyl-D-alanine ligase/alanine racemase [Algoriphagus sediminis]|uniref:Alanine racemase n=1 Tax=Algoriphagus sediminis TaxID=3057113 RepID=A0ABT7YBN4_9BACT|nr:bifunctional UDP-N-acetylmuramoyl-tripeptide:D-alanyl-D-alanine ligase/alanine racemase [Algoriphagus sediminis]MDN3203935.1 bifunctional UDP-N-acetylmuramoyl-tripeptide:D-alanyl-D-alanine ligase/alanine racemase [Algoriphagus sediminis]
MLSSLSISQLLETCGGELLGEKMDMVFETVSIDSRQIGNPKKTLFVALKGAKANGEDFIPDLIDQGVQGFLVGLSFSPKKNNLDRCIFLRVPDTRKALQDIAAFQRKLFEKPVVAITGSNGKTIVKEWLGQLLSQGFNVGKSPKSYNSQVGVPLSIFGLTDYHQVAVMEAGVSKAGEMKALERMLKPDLGIFTNIGTAHDEGFLSRKDKIEEKLQLFESTSFLIYQRQNSLLSEIIEKEIEDERRISWSDSARATFVRSLRTEGTLTRIILLKEELSMHTFHVPFSDQASLENITHAIVAALTLGQSASQIQEALKYLKSVDMRLTVKDGVNNSLIIDDTYNNDLEGLKVAFDFMNQQRPKARKIVILSDLLQQGASEQVYPEVSRLLEMHQVNTLYAVGASISAYPFPKSIVTISFVTTEDLLNHIRKDDFQNDLILVTGARSFGFEKVVDFLEQRLHGTVLEINLNALTHNYNFYKRKLKPETKIMVMVKAFAYGGGSSEIANHLQSIGADYLAVAYTDEGVFLRNEGITLPIMVLNPVKESLQSCLDFDLEPVVFSVSFFEFVANFAREKTKEIKVHLDFDTGMRRLGFTSDQLQSLKKLLNQNPQVKVKSVYTHLAGADEEVHSEFSLEQLQLFNEMVSQVQPDLPKNILKHALNSAGILSFPDYQMDMVRLGIGLYGVEVSNKEPEALRPISTLKTSISQIKTIKPSETVGYSRKGVLPRGGKIATLAIGYADGYDRRFSNGTGYVLINGQKAPVVGNVCMDMVMVDVTSIQANEGDEAIVYGSGISLLDQAKSIGTIPYELLTNISTRVKRVYYLD